MSKSWFSAPAVLCQTDHGIAILSHQAPRHPRRSAPPSRRRSSSLATKRIRRYRRINKSHSNGQGIHPLDGARDGAIAPSDGPVATHVAACHKGGAIVPAALPFKAGADVPSPADEGGASIPLPPRATVMASRSDVASRRTRRPHHATMMFRSSVA